MKGKLTAGMGILLCLHVPSFAHRLNEYLQATMISVEGGRVQISVRLVPGVTVLPIVLATLDTNRDGTISEAEGQNYARQVLRDLSINVDGQPLQPNLESVQIPRVGEMKEGLGEIRIQFSSMLPESGGTHHKLVFRNRHQSPIAAYLVNCLIPRDPHIKTIAQNRSHDQSVYELAFTQTSGQSGLAFSVGNLGGFLSMFCLGLRHIAEGTDHLLFLLALLLPSPLLASGARWNRPANVRRSVKQVIRIVTAFTVGHSITLALAALGIVLVPSRPVEVLIAASILVSSLHALRPIFPGREPAIAAGFGLVHGLAFAAALGQLGLGLSARLADIFAFNVGIEMMQLIVAAATMPSLILLSRTSAYSFLRVGGALLAALASLGWIGERWLNLHSSVDVITDATAHYAAPIAGLLFLVSLLCWYFHNSAARYKGTAEPISRQDVIAESVSV